MWDYCYIGIYLYHLCVCARLWGGGGDPTCIFCWSWFFFATPLLWSMFLLFPYNGLEVSHFSLEACGHPRSWLMNVEGWRGELVWARVGQGSLHPQESPSTCHPQAQAPKQRLSPRSLMGFVLLTESTSEIHNLLCLFCVTSDGLSK